ncbi:hypothetical protein MRY87_09665 [bacterium]|nr:hypothetical protein [bacterium]
MVRNISGQSLTALSALTTQSETKSPTRNRLSPDLVGNNRLVGNVEKHLDDFKKGKGYLSKEVMKDVFERQARSSTELSQIDPSLSRLYNGISTGLTYSKKARFISGTSQMIETSRKLLDLYS